jgi:carbon monoxide dehydrogenase subunit G
VLVPGLVAAVLLLATPRVAGAGAVEAIATAQVAAAPEQVFGLLTDFGAWERVFSGIRVLRAEQLDAESARVRHLTRVIGRPVACTMAATLRPAARQLDLVLDDREPHDLAELASFWSVTPAPGGGSNVELRIVARSGFPIPEFVERHIVEQSARRSVDDLVRALARVASIPAYADR